MYSPSGASPQTTAYSSKPCEMNDKMFAYKNILPTRIYCLVGYIAQKNILPIIYYLNND